MRTVEIITLTLALAAGGATLRAAMPGERWTAEEKAIIASLRLAVLDSLPNDPSNRHADDPRAARLGHQLFFDTRLSSNGKVSCATCHLPERDFQDGTALAKGVGVTDRRTMPVASTAWSAWQFWDGRADSQWAQALGPLESPVEHGGDRSQYTRVIIEHYRKQFETVFGSLPSLERIPEHAGPVANALAHAAWRALPSTTQDEITHVYVNIGKAIAAYERLIRYGESRFDVFADSLTATGRAPADILSADETAGLRLFVGKAQCANCHNGPRFTDDHFHNTGVTAAAGLPPDAGRAAGAPKVQDDPFNCRGKWSDAPEGSCQELEFMVAEGAELQRAFKTPSLRNVATRAPYMHAGQLPDLDAVVAHYNRAPTAPAGHSELKPLRLSTAERRQLVAFLSALSAPLVAPAGFLEAPR